MTGVDRAEPGPVVTPDPVASPLRVAQARRRRFVLIFAGLGAGVFVVAVSAMVIGSVAVPPMTVLRILGLHLAGLGEPTWTTAQDSIIWLIRFPRVILGLIVGAGLSVVGVAIQAMVRNPIADTYVLAPHHRPAPAPVRPARPRAPRDRRYQGGPRPAPVTPS